MFWNRESNMGENELRLAKIRKVSFYPIIGRKVLVS